MDNEQALTDKEVGGETTGQAEAVPPDEKERLDAEQDAREKYLRLYAEFENYKKRVGRDKEELLKYGNERLLNELLPVIDHLEMALKHASDDVSSGLVQGVDMTLKELKRTLQKFGLTEIRADGQVFDPVVHEAMAQVERDDVDANTVVEEYRKGFMLNDKVIRAAMVAVSKKPVKDEETNREIHMKEEE